jgi:hypothetical protein
MTRRPGTRRSAIGAAAVVLAALVAACGTPEEIEATPLGSDAVDLGLTVDTTVPGQASPPSEPPLGVAEEVTLYFVLDGRLVVVPRVVTGPVTLTDVTAELAVEPPRAEGAPRVRSLVAAGDVVSISLRGGVAQVDLAPRLIDLGPTEQRLAVAQIVMALTGRPGVGQVTFTSDRRPISVIRADGTLTTAAVSRDDFVAVVR